MAESGIYEIVNLVNGKRYVGSSANLLQRKSVHLHYLRKGSHHSFILQRAWLKHGESAFAFRVLEYCLPCDLISREQHHIDISNPEYNIAKQAAGGGGPMSEDAKEALRERNRNRAGTKASAETRARISAAKMGNTATRGKKRSAEAVEKTAAAHRGLKRSAETRAKISEKAKGRKFVRFNDDYRSKLSKAFKGKPKSPEHMAALQEGRRQRAFSDEQRAQIGAASRAAWAKRKAATA